MGQYVLDTADPGLAIEEAVTGQQVMIDGGTATEPQVVRVELAVGFGRLRLGVVTETGDADVNVFAGVTIPGIGSMAIGNRSVGDTVWDTWLPAGKHLLKVSCAADTEYQVCEKPIEVTAGGETHERVVLRRAAR